MRSISLIPPSRNDAEAIARLLNNKKIWNNVRDYIPHPYAISDALNFIEVVSKEKPTMTFGIFREKELCGVIGLKPQSDIYRMSVEVGYWIGEPYWGQGIAHQALEQIISFGFTELNINRIFAAVFSQNAASIKVLEKAGFQKEGILKKAVFKNGEFLDEIRYGLLKKDQLS